VKIYSGPKSPRRRGRGGSKRSERRPNEFAYWPTISAAVAIGFMKSVVGVRSAMERGTVPIWLQPAIGGLIVRLIAIAFPQILGVGYAATDDAVRASRP